MVAVVLADGFEEIEALTVIDVLRRANCPVSSFALDGVNVRGSHGITVVADSSIDQLNQNACDALVLPGGQPGSNTLANDSRVINLIRSFHSNNKLIAAICAAPIALQAANILNAVNITSHPSVSSSFPNSIYLETNVVTHNNIITSRSPATALAFAFSILDQLGFNSNPIKAAMLFIS